MRIIAGWGEPATLSTTAAEDLGSAESARVTAEAMVALPASTTTAPTAALTAICRPIEHSLVTHRGDNLDVARR